MRLEEEIVVRAPRELVWDYITNPATYLDFIDGLTRWEVAGDRESGLGARYRMLLKVGSAQVGGLVEIVEYSPPGDMAWSSVTGIDQRARWRLRDAGEGRTRVNFRFAYGVAGGGIAGIVSERVAARPLSKRFRHSLETLKRDLEEKRYSPSATPASTS